MYKIATLFVKNWHAFPSIKELISVEGINFGKVFELYLIDPILRILKKERVVEEREKDRMAFFKNIFFSPIESLKLFFYFFIYYLKKNLISKKELKNPVWFLARHHSLFKLLPLFKLMKKNKIDFQILIWASSKEEWLFLFKNNLNFQILGKTRNQELMIKSKKKTRKLLSNWQKIKKEKLLEIFLKKQGLTDFKKPIESYLAKFLQRYAFNFCQGVFEAKEEIKRIKSSLFVSTNDLNPTASIFVYTCRKNKIPTLMLQHGMICNFPLSNFISDKIGAWGDYTKEVLVKKLKRNPTSIVVTGHPFFDQEYPHYQYKPKFEGLKKKEKAVGILTTIYGDPKKEAEILKKLIKTLAGFEKVKIRIRTHPGQEIALVKDFVNKKRLKAKINEPISLKEFINNQDLILTQDTTAGLEAILLGKPLIYLNLVGRKDTMPYAKFGAAVGVYKISELPPKLKRLLKSRERQETMQEAQKRFIEKYLKLDGKAALRILRLIKKSALGN